MIVFDDICDKSSYKVKQCQRYHVPLLQREFVDDCLSHNKLLSKDKFIISGQPENDDFKKGKIVGENLVVYIIYR